MDSGLGLVLGDFGRVLMPALSSLLIDSTSEVKALIFFTCLYVAAWMVSLQLPLPSHRERPLHDVEENSKASLTRGRKRSVTYQTV